MSEATRIALVQAELAWAEPAQNREHLDELLAGISEHVDLALLPETFTTGFLGRDLAGPEHMDGRSVAWMRDWAQKLDAVICGSITMTVDQHTYNRLLWVRPDGSVAFYDKKHLFAYAGEHKRFSAGQDRPVWDWGEWRVSPQVCYDLRFPVWTRYHSGFNLQVYVANWPTPRADAWTTLLRARAMENQCYVAAVNRVGRDGNDHDYPGLSAIYDPLGRPVIEMAGDEAVGIGTIEVATVDEIRQRFPFLADADSYQLGD